MSCIVVAGLVIAVCYFGVPAFITKLALTWSKVWITTFTVFLDILVVVIGGFMCWGIKKIFNMLFP